MTKEMKELIDRELDAALESGDSAAVDRAIVNAMKASNDCQYKTGDRMKVIAIDHPILVADVKEIKNLVATAKKTAWQVGFSAVKWILIGGGGTEFVRWLIEQFPN